MLLPPPFCPNRDNSYDILPPAAVFILSNNISELHSSPIVQACASCCFCSWSLCNVCMWADVSVVHAIYFFKVKLRRVGEFVYMKVFGSTETNRLWDKTIVRMNLLARASSRLPEMGIKSAVLYLGRLVAGFLLRRSGWDLWRTVWHWSRFFSEYFCFPCQYLFHYPITRTASVV
jgi:hypothetical protein